MSPPCCAVLHQLEKTSSIDGYLGPFGRETKTALVLEASFVHLDQYVEKYLFLNIKLFLKKKI